jgi:hypothetical protein
MDVIQTFGVNGGESYDIVCENNLITNFDGQICMTENNGDPDFHDWDVRNNIYVNVDMQANVGIPDFRFYNNTLYNVGSTNKLIMYLYDGSGKSNFSNAEIKNNIIIPAASIGSYGQVVSIGRTGSNVSVSNNYIARLGTYGGVSGFNDPNGINGGNPMFADASGSDFQLLASSPAIDRGIALSWFDHDYSNASRPQGSAWDIGAFEFAGSGGSNSLVAPRNLRITQ